MSKKHKMSIKTSDDFKDNPEGAIDALEKTGLCVFMITKNWFTDKRAQKEWRFAKDMGKPLLYMFDMQKYDPIYLNRFLFEVPSLIGTVNYYGNMKETSEYIKAIVAAYANNNDLKL